MEDESYDDKPHLFGEYSYTASFDYELNTLHPFLPQPPFVYTLPPFIRAIVNAPAPPELTSEQKEQRKQQEKRKYQKEKVSGKDMILSLNYTTISKDSRFSKGRWQCPFTGCAKGPLDPLSKKQQPWRHMVNVHKEMDSGLYIDNIDGTLSSTIDQAPTQAQQAATKQQLAEEAGEEFAHEQSASKSATLPPDQKLSASLTSQSAYTLPRALRAILRSATRWVRKAWALCFRALLIRDIQVEGRRFGSLW